MGLQSAMTTALTGLQAAETSIDVIGNNIANSNTVGFKGSDVIFATQFLQTQSIGSAPSSSSGGTNPRQIGLGVKVAQISPDFSQGTIEISSNPLDLAIQGDGFLVVQGSQGERLFTRNGQLSLNSINEVVTSTGNRLLGYGVNDRYELQTATVQPITIPLGAQRVAQSTSEARFAGVLNPEVEAASTPAVVTSEVLGDSTVAFPSDTDVAGVGVALREAPAAGTAAENTSATTTLGAGTYRYRVAFRDGDGNISSASTEWSATIGATSSIDISGLLPAGSTFPEWVLYRTEANGSDFFQQGIYSTAATLPINDAVGDVALAANPALDTRAVDNGTYNYYVTYYNSTNGVESRPSDQISGAAVSTEGSSIRLDLSVLDPPPTGSGFNQVRIYRNASGDTSTYYLVDSVTAATSTVPMAAYIDKSPSSDLLTASTELDFDGPRAGSGTALVNLQSRNGDTYDNPFDLGTATSGVLRFGGEQGGSLLEPLELTIDNSTTVQTLMDFMSDALGLQQASNVSDFPLPSGGGSISISNGQLVVTSNYGEQSAVDIPLTAFRLTPDGASAPDPVNVAFSQTQAANGPGTTTEFLVYDSLGSPLTVRINTVLESKNANSTTYRWYASSGDSAPTPPDQSTVVGNGVMVFDNRGDLISAPSARISVFRELSASESPLEIDLNLDSVTSLAETDAAGNPTSSFNMTSQDGFPPGVLTDFIITESGGILGQFSNGTQRTLGQVVMARFANAQGLRQIGDSLFAQSVNSGEALIGDPGADGLGSLTAGAVELSNSDIGQDLVEMILAQTQYQAGSRVISAAQELLDELLALQR
ncbi:flagellar hook-basal body complex protein [Botrimarina hoheduenensis]|uniref:Flagellar hook protein FlgE n=1 Tax=Botrimarina hoheduenensis TaxID=2528000 RepID=A0A5C5VX40_9BACT|nr:flagellar hook-basal body complex protein [Botrimarina hoheduenensis]TWT43188.1 Flagellar hook protein FlgE [Botrimarina hoheduenensis]